MRMFRVEACVDTGLRLQGLFSWNSHLPLQSMNMHHHSSPNLEGVKHVLPTAGCNYLMLTHHDVWARHHGSARLQAGTRCKERWLRLKRVMMQVARRDSQNQ